MFARRSSPGEDDDDERSLVPTEQEEEEEDAEIEVVNEAVAEVRQLRMEALLDEILAEATRKVVNMEDIGKKKKKKNGLEKAAKVIQHSGELWVREQESDDDDDEEEEDSEEDHQAFAHPNVVVPFGIRRPTRRPDNNSQMNNGAHMFALKWT